MTEFKKGTRFVAKSRFDGDQTYQVTSVTTKWVVQENRAVPVAYFRRVGPYGIGGKPSHLSAEKLSKLAHDVVQPEPVAGAASVKLSKPQMARLYREAHAAGLAAGRAVNPRAMVVSEHENVFDDNSPVKKSYFVSEGVCGFGWVQIRPGTSRFARWAVARGYARGSAYHGGVTISSPRELGQSLERNAAYANAFAEVLTAAGITAYGQSRID